MSFRNIWATDTIRTCCPTTWPRARRNARPFWPCSRTARSRQCRWWEGRRGSNSSLPPLSGWLVKRKVRERSEEVKKINNNDKRKSTTLARRCLRRLNKQTKTNYESMSVKQQKKRRTNRQKHRSFTAAYLHIRFNTNMFFVSSIVIQAVVPYQLHSVMAVYLFAGTNCCLLIRFPVL